MSTSMLPCFDLNGWIVNATAVLGKAAATIHDGEISGDVAAATQALAAMLPDIDGLAAEFRLLLGKPARPDLADETLFVVTTETPRSVTGPFSSEYSARTFGDYAGSIRPYSIEPLLSPESGDSDDD